MNKKAELQALNTGARLMLTNGEECEFVRVKRTRFIGIMNDTSYNIPIEMFDVVVENAAEVKDEVVKGLTQGDLFYTYRDKQPAELYEYKKQEGKYIVGLHPVTKKRKFITQDDFYSKV